MDTKLLVEKLKEQGLPMAEDMVEKLLDTVLDWLAEEVVKSENKYDDLLIAVIPALKPTIKSYVDVILQCHY